MYVQSKKRKCGVIGRGIRWEMGVCVKGQKWIVAICFCYAVDSNHNTTIVARYNGLLCDGYPAVHGESYKMTDTRTARRRTTVHHCMMPQVSTAYKQNPGIVELLSNLTRSSAVA